MMQSRSSVWEMLNGRKHILIVAIVTLAVVHLRSRENFPFTSGYVFPLQDFLVHFLGTLALFEIQFWTFRHLYEKKLYEQGFSLHLVWRVLALKSYYLFTFLLHLRAEY